MSLSHRGRRKKWPTYILIGDGFDELEVIYCLHKFRQAGLPIKSVSLFDKLVYSRQGIGLQADYALADIHLHEERHCLLILPAGGRNGDALRRDARVKSLLQSLDSGDVDIAITNGRCHLADEVDRLMTRPTYQPGHDEELAEFIDSLTNGVA